MENKLFYNLREEPFDSRSFVDDYSNMYFDSEKESICPFPFLYKTKHEEEDKILKLLEEDYSWTYEDVLNILVWKTGAKKYEYSNNKITLTPPGRSAIDITMLAKKIIENLNELRIIAVKGNFAEAYANILDVVTKSGTKNIGTVYCITLLFFLSMGKVAIYDKQAHKSLLAIKNKELPGNSVGYSTPPDKKEKGKVIKMYNDFYKLLIELFPDYPNGNIECKRRIDRALWVYGHYFRV